MKSGGVAIILLLLKTISEHGFTSRLENQLLDELKPQAAHTQNDQHCNDPGCRGLVARRVVGAGQRPRACRRYLEPPATNRLGGCRQGHRLAADKAASSRLAPAGLGVVSRIRFAPSPGIICRSARRGTACRLGCQRRAPAALAAASLMSGGGHPPFGRASSDSFLGHPALAQHLYAGPKTICRISRNGSTCPFLNREQICSSRLWLNERGRQLRPPISPSRSLRVCSALLTSRFQTSAI